MSRSTPTDPQRPTRVPSATPTPYDTEITVTVVLPDPSYAVTVIVLTPATSGTVAAQPHLPDGLLEVMLEAPHGPGEDPVFIPLAQVFG